MILIDQTEAGIMNANTRSLRADWLMGAALLLMLILTRSGHFGSSFKLPDASWAMFWLSGAFALRWWWPAIMMIAAAIVDYFVISNGVSSYCVTPAYPFLIPAYLSLWFSGRWVAGSLSVELRSALRVAISIINGVTFAFIISNASFYAFAGYFPALSIWHYTQSVMQYWPGYLWHTSVYVITGLLLKFIVESIRKLRVAQQTSPT
jgi:hypothetical protein